MRESARLLTAELSGGGLVRFHVRAHGHRRLELLVWPESGLDNFVEEIHSREDVERAEGEFRRIVALYAEGRRPPFSELRGS